MSEPRFSVSDATRARQAQASDPEGSAWVSANAGSGKTTVLVARVLRLLLTGVDPSRIVCLTFTTAAAANMQLKLFASLREWATMDAAALEKTLLDLAGPGQAAPMDRARTLFATALETPGGLKIDTIHGFCTRILQSAPFEANVPARFDVMQETEAAQVTQGAIRETLTRAARDPSGLLGEAMARIAQDSEETRFTAVIEQMLAQRALLGDGDGVLLPLAELRQRAVAALGIETGETPATAIVAFANDHFITAEVAALIDVLRTGKSKTDPERADFLAAALAATDDDGFMQNLAAVFLTGKGERRKRFLTEKLAKAHPDAEAALEKLFLAFCGLQDRLKSMATLERSEALLTLAHDILRRIENLKSRQRKLDFEDIIIRTRSLLTRVEAGWVLYKLDAGIDHLLVDEAQDTSPAQWDIVRQLAGEFFAGHGARSGGTRRTVFAVGDEKQSIFSFQKAEPEQFDQMRRWFAGKVADAQEAGHRFDHVRLDQSFRSTGDVMAAVDAVFAAPDHHKGLVFVAGEKPAEHRTAREGGVGAVDLWPLEENDPKEERPAWEAAPVDAPSTAVNKLASKLARVLKRWTIAGRDDLGRAFSPGDVLIVMRRRNALFQAIVRELKQASVPVAGLDRLDVTSHVAVEDLLAVAGAALLPEDDLTLAVALKTPIHGLDDEDLLRLAPERSGSLRHAVTLAAEADPSMAKLDARLGELEQRALCLGPFAFFARLLGPEGGRKAMLSRLGAEAGDALDAFVNTLLEFERINGPSLRHFVEHAATASQVIKRDLAEAGAEVRVMTVHGAKGLEAPLVIIPDLGEPKRDGGKTLFLAQSSHRGSPFAIPLWVPRKELHAPATLEAQMRDVAMQEDERRRLLYVALTRARDRLILCGTRGKSEPKPESWYMMAQEALAASCAEVDDPDPQAAPGSKVLRYQIAQAEVSEPVAAPLLPVANIAVPDWLASAAPLGELPPVALNPSQAGGQAVPNDPDTAGGRLSGVGEARFANATLANTALANAALAEGRLAHRLLQHLPVILPEMRAKVAEKLAKAQGEGIDPARLRQIAMDAVRLLQQPALQALFSPDSVAEVTLRGEITLADGRIRDVAGRIDRLAIEEDTVWIADYKSGRPPYRAAQDDSSAQAIPAQAISAQTLSQIAIYHHLVEKLYPHHKVRSLVVYIADGFAVEARPEERQAALARL
jgi:ATP-dependent helicase/nuclease subunit A